METVKFAFTQKGWLSNNDTMWYFQPLNLILSVISDILCIETSVLIVPQRQDKMFYFIGSSLVRYLVKFGKIGEGNDCNFN